MTTYRYRYLGGHWTRLELEGMQCNPVMIR